MCVFCPLTDRILMQDMHRLTCEHHGLPHDFDALATLQQRLPHGAPATVQLLAYAAGALHPLMRGLIQGARRIRGALHHTRCSR